MPEKDKESLVETLARALVQRALGSLSRYAERFMKRIVRLVGLFLAGIVVALIGVAFLAVGAVKWLAVLLPSWLAWLIVGIILLLLGVVLTLTTFLALKD